MVFQAPMYQQDEGEGVRFYPLFLCIFICITRIHYVCLSLSVLIYEYIHGAYWRQWELVDYLWHIFAKRKNGIFFSSHS